MLHSIPQAARLQLTKWAAVTQKELMSSAAGLKKHWTHTGQLKRNVGWEQSVSADQYQVKVGTGLGGRLSVKYARIQDEGGDIVPKKTHYLTIPFKGVKGSARNYHNTFFYTAKSGALILAMQKWTKVSGGENFKRRGGFVPLFTLVKRVTIPATHWFGDVIARRKRILQENMSAGAIKEVAEKMEQSNAFRL